MQQRDLSTLRDRLADESGQTVTQFAAAALGISSYPPPEPKRGARYGSARRCWLCGGETAGEGWPQALAIAPTFTQHNTAKCCDSDAVCQPCAAVTRAESFQAIVTTRALPIKTWTQCGWHSYSHFIRETGHYEAPVPSRVREILTAPPPGRWLLCLNTSGQKHTIFRATVASDRDCFPVQIDEDTLWVRHGAFLACLADFERLAALGAGRDEIATGDYHPETARRAGLAAWRQAEEVMRPWRSDHPGLVDLVAICARSRKWFAENCAADAPAPSLAVAGKQLHAAVPHRQTPGQMSLF